MEVLQMQSLSRFVLATRKRSLAAALAPIALILLSAVTFAQTGGTGSIKGTVTDPSGALITGATVTAINVATGIPTVAVTTDAGVFVLSLLQPGTYTVTITGAGFETLTQQQLIVDALATVTLNPTLQMGRASQSITVSAEPTILMTDDVKLGSSMEN